MRYHTALLDLHDGASGAFVLVASSGMFVLAAGEDVNGVAKIA